jgi:UDP-GlcNAc:undecaprenyl-phosphate GlcNAc-1-phosphate transferase
MLTVLTAASAFLLSVLLVAIVLRVSRWRAWFDKQDERKIHNGQVPRLGGVGFATAFIIVAGVLTAFDQGISYGLRFLPVLAAMPLVLAFGVVDDFVTLRPRYKLIVQSAAALLVIAANFTFHRISFPSIGINIEFGWFGLPLTFIWIVGVTNALNLIDGVDGLAGGVAAIASLSYAAIFASSGNAKAAILCISLAAAVGGFLVFNLPLPKARIFMGDGGSQFLGFMLALLPLLDNGQGRASLPLPYAGALLLIPIFDTFAAIWRRLRDGRRIDSPDRQHMHHKLLGIGLQSRAVDLIVWGLQCLIGTLVYLAYLNVSWRAFFLLLAAYISGSIFYIIIHYINKKGIFGQN